MAGPSAPTELGPELGSASNLRPHLRGWSHAVAAVAAVVVAPVVIAAAPGGRPRSAVALYALSVIALFGVSACYHRFRWGPRMHALWRRLDHSMIYVAIAATYTPIALLSLPPADASLVLRLVWGGAAAGIAVQLLWRSAPRWITVALYATVGWAALVVIDSLWHGLGVGAFVLVVVGGVLHTAGAAVYATRRPDPWPRWFGFHEVFHLFTIAAVAAHYVAVAGLVVPRG